MICLTIIALIMTYSTRTYRRSSGSRNARQSIHSRYSRISGRTRFSCISLHGVKTLQYSVNSILLRCFKLIKMSQRLSLDFDNQLYYEYIFKSLKLNHLRSYSIRSLHNVLFSFSIKRDRRTKYRRQLWTCNFRPGLFISSVYNVII